MKLLLIAFTVCCFWDCNNSKSSADFYMPGQFEPQEAVWLGWEDYEPVYPVNKDMIKSLLPYVEIKLVTATDSMQHIAKAYLSKYNIDSNAIQYYVMPNNEFWMRDHGAAFIVNNKGESKAVDFVWGAYGYRQWLTERNNGDVKKVDSILTKSRASKRGKIDSMMGAAEKIPIVKSWIKIEGGAIEVNGKGTLILNEPLTLSRNEGVSKDSIAQEFKRVLGLKNIIWLQQGLAEDPHIWQVIAGKYVGIGTGGHTDEFVKFADANTILLAWVDEAEKDNNPINKINYERMNINFNILSSATNEDGKPFTIIKVPLPDIIVKPIKILPKGEWEDNFNVPVSVLNTADGLKPGDSAFRIAASSYLNYYVTNGMVLLPTYIKEGGSKEKEETVKQIFTKAFPGRKLIWIEAMPLNWEGGGIHCGTQQQPKVKQQK